MTEQTPEVIETTYTPQMRDHIIVVTRLARGPHETVEDLTRAQAAALNLCLEVLGISNSDIDNYRESEQQ